MKPSRNDAACARSTKVFMPLTHTERLVARSAILRPQEPIIFGVMPDPDPNHEVAASRRESTILPAAPHRPKRIMRGQLLEIERAVTGVARPDPIYRAGEALNFDGQFSVVLPELRRRFGDHSGAFPGQSRSVPFSIAASASFTRKSNLPAAASASICRSHASSKSTSRSFARNSSFSVSERCRTASMISPTVLTQKG